MRFLVGNHFAIPVHFNRKNHGDTNHILIFPQDSGPTNLTQNLFLSVTYVLLTQPDKNNTSCSFTWFILLYLHVYLPFHVVLTSYPWVALACVYMLFSTQYGLACFCQYSLFIFIEEDDKSIMYVYTSTCNETLQVLFTKINVDKFM